MTYLAILFGAMGITLLMKSLVRKSSHRKSTVESFSMRIAGEEAAQLIDSIKRT